MCLLVYGATGPGTGKENGKGKEAAKKENNGKEKGKDGDITVDFDAPPSLLELLSAQHRALTASVRTSLHPSISHGTGMGHLQPIHHVLPSGMLAEYPLRN